MLAPVGRPFPRQVPGGKYPPLLKQFGLRQEKGFVAGLGKLEWQLDYQTNPDYADYHFWNLQTWDWMTWT